VICRSPGMATRTTRSYCIWGDNRNGVCAGTPTLVTRQRAGLMIRCAVQYDAVLPSTPPTWDLGPLCLGLGPLELPNLAVPISSGAGSGAPRAGLWPWEARQARPLSRLEGSDDLIGSGHRKLQRRQAGFVSPAADARQRRCAPGLATPGLPGQERAGTSAEPGSGRRARSARSPARSARCRR